MVERVAESRKATEAPARKRNGVDYTLEAVVAMLVHSAVRSPDDLLLDPSCGDGGENRPDTACNDQIVGHHQEWIRLPGSFRRVNSAREIAANRP